MADPFDALAKERFLSLTTFRKSGESVSTPVWIGRDGEALVVTTPEGSGKVKRLRNSPRVELRPCSRMGKVDDGVDPVAGEAQIIDDPAEIERITEIFRKKYGIEYSVVMRIERLGGGSGSSEGRVMLRILAA